MSQKFTKILAAVEAAPALNIRKVMVLAVGVISTYVGQN